MLNGIPSSMPHLKSGRIRALAVTSARRSPAAAVPVGSSAAEFAAYLRSELVKWGKVVKASGATVN